MPSPNKILSKVNWTIQEYTDSESKPIISLLQSCFGSELTTEKKAHEHWIWEFFSVPQGPSEIFVAKDGNQFVGHYGCIPMIFSTPNGEQKARLVVDVMTHPEYQKQGMFVALGLHSMHKIQQKGSIMALGFPTTSRYNQVMPGHFKVGWFPHIKIPVLGRPLDPSAVAKAKFSNRFVSKLASWGLSLFLKIRPWKSLKFDEHIEVKIVQSPDIQLDEFWEKIKSQYGFMQRRDFQFIKWRFFDSPHRKYHFFLAKNKGSIVGYAALRLFNHLGLDGTLIIDLVTEKESMHVRELLLDEIYKFALNSKSSILACMINDKITNDLIRKRGFINTGEVYTLILHIDQKSISQNDLGGKDDWFLSWADFDVL